MNALSLEALFLSVFVTIWWPMRPAIGVEVYNTPFPIKLPTGWEGICLYLIGFYIGGYTEA